MRVDYALDETDNGSVTYTLPKVAKTSYRIRGVAASQGGSMPDKPATISITPVRLDDGTTVQIDLIEPSAVLTGFGTTERANSVWFLPKDMENDTYSLVTSPGATVTISANFSAGGPGAGSAYMTIWYDTIKP